MPSAKNQDLVASLVLRDQLSGPLAQAKGNLTAMETGLGRLDATARATGSSLGGLGGSIGNLAKAGAVAFVAFKAFDFVADSLKAASDEEAGIAQLTASLKANVEGFNGNTAAIEKTVKAREALAFSDDEIRSSLSALVGATHDVNKAFDTQRLAMDLARFENISLAEASDQLIKVQAGSLRSLKALGIELKAGTSATEAFGRIQEVVGGQAEKFGDTNAAAFKRAEIAIHDLQEVIGTPLLNAMSAVADAAAKAAKALSDFAGDAGDLIDRAAKLGHSVGDAAGRVPVLADAIDAVTGAFHAARDPADQWFGAVVKTGQAAKAADEEFQRLTDAAWEVSKASTEAANKARDNTDALGGMTGGLDEAARAALALTVAIGTSADATDEQKKAAQEAAAQFKDLDTVFDGFNSTVSTGADGLDQYGFAANKAFGDAYVHAGDLKDAINAIPTSKTISITFKTLAAGQGTTNVSERDQALNDPSPDQGQAIADWETQFFADLVTRGDKATSAAKKGASDLAAAYKDMVSAAFDKAKRTADTLFDALHDRHVRAIKDAEDLAEKQHSAALQNIADTLKAAQAADAAPVNAAEKELRDRQQAQQRRDLVEAQAAAQAALQANRDPTATADLQRSLRSATEALQNFDAQAAIDRLKVVQTGLDNIAQGKADVATKAADAELAAAKKKAQDDLDAETKANAKRKADFDLALAALEKKDLAAGKTKPQIDADIAALEKKFGITIDPRTGLHHIDDPLVNAIKNFKPVVPQVINNFKPTFRVFISAREVAAAIAAGQSPTAAGGARTGGGGRG